MRLLRYFVPCTLLILSCHVQAQATEDPEDFDSIKDLITHFGAYFGFDLSKPPENEPLATLLNEIGRASCRERV